MKLHRLLLWDALVIFASLTAFATYQYGVQGLLAWATHNAATTLFFVDLLIALTLVMIWIARDAPAHGMRALPYLLTTVLLGSVGPLVYLLRRPAAGTSGEPA